jgi:hypothetical protein
MTTKINTKNRLKKNFNQVSLLEYCNSFNLSVAIDLLGLPTNPTNSI